MSTSTQLAVTAPPQKVPPSNQDLTFRTYHIVLLLEAIVMTTWISAEYILLPTMFLFANKVPFPQHLARHFWLLTGITALMFSGGLYAAVQRKPRWIQVCWHLLYYVSYFASFWYALRITLQAMFPGVFADSGLPHNYFVRVVFLAAVMLELFTVDIPYVTMVEFAIGQRDRHAGPIFQIYESMRRQ